MDDQDIKPLRQSSPIDLQTNATKPPPASQSGKKTSRRSDESTSQKRRCVSTACTACRRRKSKCNGAVPSCAACASVYGTECIYDPSSDHRRKGVYRAKVDSTKASKLTLQTLIEAILNVSEDDVPDVVKKIRTCDSLDTLAEQISKQKTSVPEAEQSKEGEEGEERFTFDMPIEGERELACKMGELRLMNGSVRFIGGTSHLIYLDDPRDDAISNEPQSDASLSNEDPVTSWTRVTQDKELITHLMNMYFSWHYTYFATLSKSLFYRDFLKGKHAVQHESTMYCSSLLVNAILTLGCHFTSIPGAYSTPGDSGTKGDHFFAEAKRLIVENDEFERPKITTVQALALLSIREAGCGREAKGWAYSGMAFRMAQDIGLNFDNNGITADSQKLSEYIIDARRMTFWGCFLFDKTWSNYLGRLPQIPKNSYNMPKYEVFPTEDAEPWTSYTDTGFSSTPQPSRTRAIGLQLLKLCEISSELLLFFYCPNHISRLTSKSLELKTLSELHQRLEAWRKDLPIELEPREGQLPNVLLVHIFFHLQYIHLFRPFLRYSSATSPLPPNVSPRRICTANAGAISKLMRLYKKSWDLGQISSIAVYMIHSACTIHLLNLPEKTAKKDIIHGVKHLEEIAENWPCAKRTLSIISMLAQKWNVELPKEASAILQRTGQKYGHFNAPSVPSPQKQTVVPPSLSRRTVPSTTSKPENSTSFSQRSQNQMNSQQDIPPSVNDLIMASASLAEISGISSPMEQPLASNGLSVDSKSGSLDTSWLCPSLPQAVNDDQNYQQRQQRQQQRFVSMSDAQGLGSIPSGSTHLDVGVRQVAPSQLFQSLDQNWLLNHNTGWHQNNEAWNRPDSGMPTSDQIEELQSDNIAMPQRPSVYASNVTNFDDDCLDNKDWFRGPGYY